MGRRNRRMDRKREVRKMDRKREALKDIVETVVPDDLPDGAWFAMQEEVVDEFNEREGTDFDVLGDVLGAYDEEEEDADG